MNSIPVTELKNTSSVSALCLESKDPVLVTKNGRPLFWLVKPEEMDLLNQASARERLYQAVEHSERQWRDGMATNAGAGISAMRERYGI